MNIFLYIKMFELVVLYRGNDSFLSFFHSPIAPIAKARVITTRNNQRTDDLNALDFLTSATISFAATTGFSASCAERLRIYATSSLILFSVSVFPHGGQRLDLSTAFDPSVMDFINCSSVLFFMYSTSRKFRGFGFKSIVKKVPSPLPFFP